MSRIEKFAFFLSPFISRNSKENCRFWCFLADRIFISNFWLCLGSRQNKNLQIFSISFEKSLHILKDGLHRLMFCQKNLFFSTVGEKVSFYFSLSVVKIFTYMGKIFQDLHFFEKQVLMYQVVPRIDCIAGLIVLPD